MRTEGQRFRRGRLLPKLIAFGVFLVVLIVLLALRNSSYASEYVFTRGLSRFWITVAGKISAVFPFSVFEIAAGLLIIYGIYCLVKFIVRLARHRKNPLVPIVNILLAALIIGTIYVGTAGFSYYREPLIDYLPSYDESITAEEAKSLVDKAIEEMNALAEKFDTDGDGCVICPYSQDELAELCRAEYSRLNDDYFNPYTVELKPLITSDIFSAFGIIGISFQPTGEANYNVNTDPTDLPFTMLHELAHSKGVMTESDANLLATYLSLTSENDFIKYSGYHNTITQIAKIQTMTNPEVSLSQVYKGISARVIGHMNAAYYRYERYQSFVTDIGTFINDIYLKLNGASNGTGSYYVAGTVETKTDASGNVVARVVTFSPVQRVAIEYLMG